LGVATGCIFVRFREGTDPRSHDRELKALRLRVAEVPRSAPHAAWVVGAGPGPLMPLVELDRVRALPEVEHAEPELLRPAARK